MALFLKFKFQTTLKLNFNGGQFYKNKTAPTGKAASNIDGFTLY